MAEQQHLQQEGADAGLQQSNDISEVCPHNIDKMPGCLVLQLLCCGLVKPRSRFDSTTFKAATCRVISRLSVGVCDTLLTCSICAADLTNTPG